MTVAPTNTRLGQEWLSITKILVNMSFKALITKVKMPHFKNALSTKYHESSLYVHASLCF
jgi:hypothetical protein